jgi:hypothetical protein
LPAREGEEIESPIDEVGVPGIEESIETLALP